MTIRKILTEPDPFLRQKSVEIDNVDDEIRKLMDDMLETMYAAPGIGLAAIQVGVPKRVIVTLGDKKIEIPADIIMPIGKGEPVIQIN